MNPDGELRFDDPGGFMEFLDMEVEDQGDDWVYANDPGPPREHEIEMDQAAGPPSQPPPAARSASNSRPSVCNNFIDDYKLAEVLKKNGLPKLRIFIVGVLGKSRTKVSLTETRFVSVLRALNLLNTRLSNSLLQSLQIDFGLSRTRTRRQPEQLGHPGDSANSRKVGRRLQLGRNPSVPVPGS